MVMSPAPSVVIDEAVTVASAELVPRLIAIVKAIALWPMPTDSPTAMMSKPSVAVCS